jgi:hypothetical protein
MVASFGDWWRCSGRTVRRFSQAMKSFFARDAHASEIGDDGRNHIRSLVALS